MRILPENKDSIAQALEILEQGGSVVHATETCYGIACDLTNVDAVSKVFGVKQRPMEQPISALFPSVGHAKQYVEWNVEAEELAKGLPGPLTLILPVNKDAPYELFPTPSGGATIGVRVSSHPIAQKLAQQFRKPISTTSANIHRHDNPYSMEDLLQQFERQMVQPDLIIDSGQLPGAAPSKIVDLSSGGQEIIRE